MCWSWQSIGGGWCTSYLMVCQQLCSLTTQTSQTDYHEALFILYPKFVELWFFTQILETCSKEKRWFLLLLLLLSLLLLLLLLLLLIYYYYYFYHCYYCFNLILLLFLLLLLSLLIYYHFYLHYLSPTSSKFG